MSDDLYEVWRDDRLIDAAARGDVLELADDPAGGPLLALSLLADGRPLPRLDVDGAALVDSRHSHRYAVRSLAAAVTVVATLSTSGVAAVVTGDPLRPAKAVWNQIQAQTGLRADGDDAHADSGSALGAASVEPRDAAASRPSEVSVQPGASPSAGLTARAPGQWPGDQAATTEDAQPSATGDPSAEQSTPPDAEDDTQPSDQQADSEEPTAPDDSAQQEPGDDSGSQPAPDDEQPAPSDQSDDDGLEDLVPSGATGDNQDGGSAQPAPTERVLPDGGDANQDQVLGGQLAGATQGADGTYAGRSTSDPTATDTTAPPPNLAP